MFLISIVMSKYFLVLLKQTFIKYQDIFRLFIIAFLNFAFNIIKAMKEAKHFHLLILTMILALYFSFTLTIIYEF